MTVNPYFSLQSYAHALFAKGSTKHEHLYFYEWWKGTFLAVNESRLFKKSLFQLHLCQRTPTA